MYFFKKIFNISNFQISNRRVFGKYVIYLSYTATFIAFVGLGIMAATFVAFLLFTDMIIKTFSRFIGPILGLQVVAREKKSIAPIYYLIIGFLTPIPFGMPNVIQISH